VVRSLGGEITLSSQLGVGTTFTINLPRDLRNYLGSNAK
jgi:signal transduction histidine kinase